MILIKYSKIFFLLSFVLLLAMCNKEDPPEETPPPPDPPEVDSSYYKGMDLSYQPFLQPYQVDYKDASGKSIENLLNFCYENGVNIIRVRLFHTPDQGNAVLEASSLNSVVNYCKKIDQAGIDILLDIHYSDTWADPGNQTPPSAWAGLDFDALSDSVYNYTKIVLNTLNEEASLPLIVQIGNETNSGFLWDYGKVWNDFNDNWPNYVKLINSANQAIEEVSDASGKEIKSMVHIAGVSSASSFYSKLKLNSAQYDMIGISYYPHFHNQNLNTVQTILSNLAVAYQKPIILVETSYPFTLGWNDWTHNIVGLEDQLIGGYPATPEGQKAFFEKLDQIMKNIPNYLGKGFVWWAPDMVAFDGQESENGSSFENLSVFDFDNKALPVWDVYRKN